MSARLTLLACGDVGPIHEPLDGYPKLAKPVLAQADLRFANVERVYSTRGTPQVHLASTHSRLPPAHLSLMNDCGFDVVALASNHALDWGTEALIDTIELLEGRGIAAVGAGRNAAEARRPRVLERNGVRVAFLAYCSVLHQGYEAGPQRAGIAPLRAHTYYEAVEEQPGVPPRVVTVPYEEDLAALIDDVAAAKREAHCVVVSVHWGIHFIPRMLADYQRIAAKAIFGAGADLILGHHAHVPKGIEVFDGLACFYSLGNFIMSQDRTPAGAQAFLRRYGPFGFRLEEDPSYARLPYGVDGKRSLIAKAVFTTEGIVETSFLPVLVDRELRPEVLRSGDPRFAEMVAYMDWASEELDHRFTVRGDEVIVSNAAPR